MVLSLSPYAPALRRFPILLMVLLLRVSFSYAFTPPQASNDGSGSLQNGFKRFTIASTLAILPFLGWDTSHNPTIIPPAAHALQQKNEALCNTGFFTNVGAWYCTDIGNIGDEGKPKPLSGDAETSVDSLMSKFDLDGGDFSVKSGKNEDQANKVGESKNGETTKVAKTKTD
mmetsp:Transcript_36946/g.66455  ORF Transcript_36946/g.66455 Transcript_36946/m.66455 type:complete len:172 (+) Transcript_36946:29-544(+)|eukprot:CAMPEP_0201884038 /NCGR_PEP_ID=MMETSP0902-20130614/16381_1 /ASSEMBLY_ACC=CAM_ASM_000551 /TAXON_ID=420261 /ORGANISM="Thalassiosira antarctica, Strain CCMP982" /LENGTH=171 /DNA_ID=CAMNT_0048412925 /DNA_START=24 /DNA_END=539 /DNA_ORIENTATION=+